MQGSNSSSSTSTSTSSTGSTNKKFMKANEKIEINKHYLVSPTTKQTNILWSVEEDSERSPNDTDDDGEVEIYCSKLVSASSMES